MKHGPLVVLVVVLSGLVCGCTASVRAPVDDPTFSGPWSTQLTQAYATTSSSLAKSILADGVVTTEELTAIKAAYVRCLMKQGFTNVVVNDDTTMSFTPPANLNSVDYSNGSSPTAECDQQIGWLPIAALSRAMTINPDNVNFSRLITQCLMRVGLAKVGYTSEDYVADLQNGKYRTLAPGSQDELLFIACQSDPLHAT